MALATVPSAVRMVGATALGPAMAISLPARGPAGGEMTLALQAHGLVSSTLSCFSERFIVFYHVVSRHLLTISLSFQAGLNLPGQPPLPGLPGPLAPPPPLRLTFTPPHCPTALFRLAPTSASALRRLPPTSSPVRLPSRQTLPVSLAALRESWVWSRELSFCERRSQWV